MHSFHLAHVPAGTSARVLACGPGAVPGLRHVEPLALMRLGAPVVSADRLQLRRLALFCAWDDESALEAFLAAHPLGQRVADGWHVRLEFVRRWGRVAALSDLPERAGRSDPDEPSVAVTLARMRLPRVPRFLRWGRPVERLVRDHPGATFATAAIRPPHTVSTFSVWRTTREMTDMVFGRGGSAQQRGRSGDVGAVTRHVDAMAERDRRDFHHEFTTLRFRPIAEHGTWDGRTRILP
ncbi:hypothetical protein [Aeromicrobium sp. CTD01-1L150]|uniref:hypothetical protein n=1 Tax=Aeromicrobium sp. CTD01-1L150 TaxID=3341830 RepID=UPI0035C18CE9